eukprot:TRINITY_DN5714_c0_g1_i3.p1 TRINITY_DN5714_c0_g1~~TRINITY_DN5714_c0_g1_i3.p1  ORF type:complete len:115 (-),score=31.18 TRINITY_DN5714_c0_g1_i3:69-413(-)
MCIRDRRKAALRAVFREFDLDGSGMVESEELLKLGTVSGFCATATGGNVRHLREHQGLWTDEENRVLFNQMDLNLSLIHISEPTRLLSISYAVFCLKKKKKQKIIYNKRIIDII